MRIVFRTFIDIQLHKLNIRAVYLRNDIQDPCVDDTYLVGKSTLATLIYAILPILVRPDDRNVYATRDVVLLEFNQSPFLHSSNPINPRPVSIPFRQFRGQRHEEEACTFDLEFESNTKRFILRTYEYMILTRR